MATLTKQGRSVAEDISRRHHLLRQFLTDVLYMDGESANVNACRMEHAVDELLLERLEGFMAFIHNCPLTAHGWLNHFAEGCDPGRDRSACRRCADCLNQASDASRHPSQGPEKSTEDR